MQPRWILAIGALCVFASLLYPICSRRFRGHDQEMLTQGGITVADEAAESGQSDQSDAAAAEDHNATRQLLQSMLGDEYEDNLKTGAKIVGQMQALAVVIKADQVPTLSQMGTLLTGFSEFVPEFAVVGAILSLIGSIFHKQQTDPVLEALKTVQSTLSDIQGQVTAWFNAVMAAIHNEDCKSRYFEVEQGLQQAYALMVAYHENPDDSNKQNLIQACSANSACDGHIRTLLGGLNGDAGSFGCDLMQVTFDGGPDTSFFKGSPTYFKANIGYLLLLAMNGIQAQSAFITLRDGNNDAWKDVSAAYADMLKAATDRMAKMMTDVTNNAPTNIQSSLNGYLGQFGSTQKNADLANNIQKALVANYNIYTFRTQVMWDKGLKDQSCTYVAGDASKWSATVTGQSKILQVFWMPVAYYTNNSAAFYAPGNDAVFGRGHYSDCAFMTKLAKDHGVSVWNWWPWQGHEDMDYQAATNFPQKEKFWTDNTYYCSQAACLSTGETHSTGHPFWLAWTPTPTPAPTPAPVPQIPPSPSGPSPGPGGAEYIHAVGTDAKLYWRLSDGADSDWQLFDEQAWTSLSVTPEWIYGIGTDGKVYSKGRHSGDWQGPLRDDTWLNLKVHPNGPVVAVGSNGQLYDSSSMDDFANGKINPLSTSQWKTASFDDWGKVWAVGTDGLLYYADYTTLHADPSSKEWTTARADTWSSISILGLNVFAIGSDGKIYSHGIGNVIGDDVNWATKSGQTWKDISVAY